MKPITILRPHVLLPGVLIALVSLAVLLPHRRGAPPASPGPAPAGQVDLVLALDTSSSMDGLIDNARQQLWESVNLLARAEPRPTLRVGLISYGHTSYDRAEGWVRLESDLTTDLDGIYARLFALRTGGGDEYVARALQVAATRMAWTQEPGARRIFIVAGNESAAQDPVVSLTEALAAARGRGITVNAIFCGHEGNHDSAGWRGLAQAGGGTYAAIDQNSAVAVQSPVDAELARLSQQLNGTYIGYGRQGATRARNQAVQDGNAAQLGGAASAARAVAKSSVLYDNRDWDLVDAAKGGKLAEVKEAELPEELRKLAPAERQAYIQKKAAERAAIQQQIDELSKKREGFIKAKKAASPKRGKDLDDAFRKML